MTLYAMAFHGFLSHELIHSLIEFGVLRQGVPQLSYLLGEEPPFFVLNLHSISLI